MPQLIVIAVVGAVVATVHVHVDVRWLADGPLLDQIVAAQQMHALGAGGKRDSLPDLRGFGAVVAAAAALGVVGVARCRAAGDVVARGVLATQGVTQFVCGRRLAADAADADAASATATHAAGVDPDVEQPVDDVVGVSLADRHHPQRRQRVERQIALEDG